MTITKRRGQVFYLPLTAITAKGKTTRQPTDMNALYALAESVKAYGVLQPITVRRLESGYGLVAGSRRLRAAALAGLTRIPCILVDADDTDAAVLALVENLHRQDIDFVGEAQALRRLISDHGLSREEAAKRIGKSPSAVTNKLRLLKLGDSMLEMIREAGLTERHARALLRLDSEGERMKVLEQVIENGLNGAKTEELIERETSEGDRLTRPVYIIRDVRLFLNSIDKGMDIMRSAGIGAVCDKDDTGADIVLTIRIPKAF